MEKIAKVHQFGRLEKLTIPMLNSVERSICMGLEKTGLARHRRPKAILATIQGFPAIAHLTMFIA
jgi:hypothetical protein